MPNLGTVNTTTSIVTTSELAATKLDDLATPDNNTDLNVTTTYHGLTPILPNDATKYLDGTGAYSVPAGGSSGITVDDEGTPLTTTATTLDFVGAGVTASGSGATKTITIPGTAALTSVLGGLGAAVTIVNANTFYDGPTCGSLAAGTWLIQYKIIVAPIVATAQAYAYTAKLWDGASAIYDESATDTQVSTNQNGTEFLLSGFTIVTLGSPTTVKVSAACNRGSSSSQIKRDVITNSATSHLASQIMALKIG